MYIIDDSTGSDELFPRHKGRGLDLSSRPRGFAYGGTAEPFPDSMLIPKSEWQARIQEMEERKSRLSDLCTAAGLKPKDQQQTNYCVPAGTMIRMADGSAKAIQDVKVIDEVMTAEGNVKKVTETMARCVREPLFTPVMECHSFLRATGGHPILTKRGYVRIDELQVGDKVAFPGYGEDQDGTHRWRKVHALESKSFEGYVFNLEVEDDHSYVAEGIGLHNCWVNAPTYCTEVMRVFENEPMVTLSAASVGAQVTGYWNVGGWGNRPSNSYPPTASSRKTVGR